MFDEPSWRFYTIIQTRPGVGDSGKQIQFSVSISAILRPGPALIRETPIAGVTRATDLPSVVLFCWLSSCFFLCFVGLRWALMTIISARFLSIHDAQRLMKISRKSPGNSHPSWGQYQSTPYANLASLQLGRKLRNNARKRPSVNSCLDQKYRQKSTFDQNCASVTY